MFWCLIGPDSYSGATASGDSKDEALFAEFINKNNTFQTNKVSFYTMYLYLKHFPAYLYCDSSIAWFYFLFVGQGFRSGYSVIFQSDKKNY